MKKLTSATLLIIFILPFLLTSCEKEKPLNEQIVGKWDVKSIQQVNYENNVKVSETTIFNKANSFSMQFVDGGTGIQYQDGTVNGLFTWELTNSTLKIIGGDQAYEWTITIDKDVLVWTYFETETAGGVTYKYEYFYTAGRVS
jgi:hypothetical protein